MSGNTQTFTEDTPVKTNWKTICAVFGTAIAVVSAAVYGWCGIQNGFAEQHRDTKELSSSLSNLDVRITRQAAHTVYDEDLERFGGLVTLHNPTLHIEMPKGAEYLRSDLKQIKENN